MRNLIRLFCILFLVAAAMPSYAGLGALEDRCGIGWDMLPGQSNPFPGGVILTLSPQTTVTVRVVYGATPSSMGTIIGTAQLLTPSQVHHYKLEPAGGAWGYYSVECSFDAGTTWTTYGVHRLKPGKATGTADDMVISGWGDDHAVADWFNRNCGEDYSARRDNLAGTKAGVIREDSDAVLITGDSAMIHCGGCNSTPQCDYNGFNLATAGSSPTEEDAKVKWQLWWNEVMQPVIADVPLIMVQGNHDECNAWADNEGGVEGYDNGCITIWPAGKFQAMPQPSLSYGAEADSNGVYYAARFGNVKLLVMNMYLDTTVRPRGGITCDVAGDPYWCGAVDWQLSAQQTSDIVSWASSTTEPFVLAASHSMIGGVGPDDHGWNYARFAYKQTLEWSGGDGKAGTEQGKFPGQQGTMEASLIGAGVTGWVMGHDHALACSPRYQQSGITNFFYCAFTQPLKNNTNPWWIRWYSHRQYTDYIGDKTYLVAQPFGTGGNFVEDARGYVVMKFPGTGDGTLERVTVNMIYDAKDNLRQTLFNIERIP